MRKDTRGAKITKVEIKRNNKISKKRYIRFQPVGLTGRRVEQYFVLWVEPSTSWLPVHRAYSSERAYRARFTVMMKNMWDAMCRQTCPVKCGAYFTGMAFNLSRKSKLILQT